MSHPFTILFRSFVRSFYKENTGAFVFVFTMMFYIVNKVDGAALFEYHYSLILGMLKSTQFLLLVFGIWFLYSVKCFAFVARVLRKPAYSFLHIVNCVSPLQRFKMLLFVQVWLMLPVLLYALCIVIAGCYKQFYIPVFLTVAYLTGICVLPAVCYVRLLRDVYKNQALVRKTVKKWFSAPVSYYSIMLRFVSTKQKLIWTGSKIFTCGLLYLVARNNNASDHDTIVAFLFFNFGVLANGVLVHRMREFEETYLGFYRGAPVSLLKRFLQYSQVYALLLLPEFITISAITPAHLQYKEAFGFALCGYSLLLLMNSISFLRDLGKKEYVRVLLLLFCVEYLFIILAGFTALYLLFFVFSVWLFFKGYYTFEKNIE